MEPIDGPLRLIDERSIEAPAAADSAAPTETPRRTSVEDLVYQRELWSKRATAARECGEELGRLRDDLRGVMLRNYFGAGCVEGGVVFARLREFLDARAETIERLSVAAVELSGASTRALEAIAEADTAGAQTID